MCNISLLPAWSHRTGRRLGESERSGPTAPSTLPTSLLGLRGSLVQKCSWCKSCRSPSRSRWGCWCGPRTPARTIYLQIWSDEPTVNLVQVLERLVKFRLQGNQIPLTEAEAGSPLAILRHEAVIIRDYVFSSQQLLSFHILFWNALKKIVFLEFYKKNIVLNIYCIYMKMYQDVMKPRM